MSTLIIKNKLTVLFHLNRQQQPKQMSEAVSNVSADNNELELELKLSKIRTQINSKLENQKHLAIILSAVEENIEEQKNEKTPVSYVVSFLSLLDQCIQDDKILDSNLAATTAYFLDLLFPFTPKPLLKQKFSEILLKLSQPLNIDAEAPLVRSTIGAIESLLLAQDRAQWLHRGAVSPNRALIALVELSFDPRPKVRKRAQDSVKQILSHPPASASASANGNNSTVHVAAPAVSDVTLKHLQELLLNFNHNKKGGADKELNSQIIHCLQLITIITSANSWPVKSIEQLCDALLEIANTSDQFLIRAAFEAFEGLFKSMTNVIDVQKYVKVLNIIFDLKPSMNDTHLSTAWLAVVAKAFEGFSALAPLESIKKLPQVLQIVSEFLSSDSRDIYASASSCLIAIINHAVPETYLLQPNAQYGITEDIYESVDEAITFVAEFIEKELFSIKYQNATGLILQFVRATILKFQSRANPDFLNIVQTVGEWRTSEKDNFPHNKEAEECLAAAIAALGPEAVLGVLPLNLGENVNGPGRAWLLPLLRDNVSCAELGFYKSQILPIVQFFESKIANSVQKESINNKIFQTIIDQIWSLLPKFCDLPKDLRSAFDEAFATQLADLMFAKVELRTFICHAWRTLVESNLAYRDGKLEQPNLLLLQQEFPQQAASTNIEYLSTIASNILTVLFNVFSYTMPESRGFVLETIEAYLRIVPAPELSQTFDKVCGMLKSAMDEDLQEGSGNKDKNKNKNKKGENSTPDNGVTMMDLVVVMAKYLPVESHNALFSIFALTIDLESKPLLQKRSYRIITNLAESEQGRASIQKFIVEIEKKLIETTSVTSQSAKASRLNAILLILDLLPQTDLYFIPAIVQEIIMATKDVNERSRGLSYQILIKMGQKMKEGGVIENAKVPGFDANAPSTESSLSEFFTMISAGLAAQNPHMISATITAISCLIFEFKNDLPIDTLMEIASTVELFLTHNSREIAKSAIGFVKVEILSLPEEMVRNNLSELLTKLMKWSHEHKGHFKSKVKHIIERLIRKFGAEEVENAIPEEDRKLVINIKKARNRAKRKQEALPESGDVAEGETHNAKSAKKKFVSAYEEALYDSDVSDDDVDIYDEDAERSSSSRKNKGKKANQFILESGDEPLNLLDRQALAHISSSKPKKFTKSDLKSKTDEFKTKNGKLVFKEDGAIAKGSDKEDPLAKSGSGIDAYLDAVKQAPVRGQKNKLKFKKTKGGDDDDGDNWSDDDDDDDTNNNNNDRAGANPKSALKKSKTLGKSKISKPSNKQKFKAKKKF
ncbi:pre-rRNA processing protein [Lodderomyces elongisporus]|uniref:pre-rRNA processing protein n=1 Tax=Lodderomyces elongisporus TaxID=36914 RepID=UPI0029217546|nr:pre-rRNA processing protein [Lodderomyces elongisporus]WLF81191.1 pre-rRNA processing protein [Lodderomyces elongisporus]